LGQSMNMVSPILTPHQPAGPMLNKLALFYLSVKDYPPVFSGPSPRGIYVTTVPVMT
ncbi:hypothetical protein LCGC14_1938340, partial [marine sediment metagenome]